jgi:hypothetical protein
MKDEQVEKLIWQEIKKRDITIHDMIGIPGHGVDPNPEDDITPRCEKGIRSNRFLAFMGSDRMKELLCEGEYSEVDDYPPLRISTQDLFRFWWNRCVVREYVFDEILEDIFTYFTEMMRLPQKEEPKMDLTLDFGQVALFPTQNKVAMKMAVAEGPKKSRQKRQSAE